MSNTQAPLLPEAFSALTPFVEKWAKETTAARMAVRESATMIEIKAFYDAILPMAEDAITLIDNYPMDAAEMPPEIARLCQLVLALCQASIAVEVHGEPHVPGATFPHGIQLKRGATPFG